MAAVAVGGDGQSIEACTVLLVTVLLVTLPLWQLDVGFCCFRAHGVGLSWFRGGGNQLEKQLARWPISGAIAGAGAFIVSYL